MTQKNTPQPYQSQPFSDLTRVNHQLNQTHQQLTQIREFVKNGGNSDTQTPFPALTIAQAIHRQKTKHARRHITCAYRQRS